MIHIVICDDDNNFGIVLSKKIEKYMQKNIDDEYDIICVDNLNALNELYSTVRIDVLFLDIMLEEQNSVDYFIKNFTTYDLQLILMTGYPEEAYNLSETNCCYYLIKSRMTDDQLAKALETAVKNQTNTESNLIIISNKRSALTVDTKNLIYIESFGNNVCLHYVSGEAVTVYQTLKHLYEKLPLCFLKCHKSFIINMNYIESYKPYLFQTNDGTNIPIAHKKFASVTASYRKYIRQIGGR